MDIETLKIISDFGFSGLVAFYLLTKTTKALNNLTNAINHQNELLILVAKKLNVRTTARYNYSPIAAN